MDEKTLRPRIEQINQFITKLQSQVLGLDATAANVRSEQALHLHLSLIMHYTPEMLVLAQRLRQQAREILDDLPEPRFLPPLVRCADCRHQVPHLWTPNVISCAAHRAPLDQKVKRRCPEFQALEQG